MTIPDDIHTDVEHDEDAGGDTIMVNTNITHPDGTSWSASGHATPPVTDDDLAELIVHVACGAAVMRDSGVWMALQQRLNLDGDGK